MLLCFHLPSERRQSPLFRVLQLKEASISQFSTTVSQLSWAWYSVLFSIVILCSSQHVTIQILTNELLSNENINLWQDQISVISFFSRVFIQHTHPDPSTNQPQLNFRTRNLYIPTVFSTSLPTNSFPYITPFNSFPYITLSHTFPTSLPLTPFNTSLLLTPFQHHSL